MTQSRTPQGHVYYTTAAELTDPAKDAERAANLDARWLELKQYVATHLDPALDKYVQVTNLLPSPDYQGFPTGWQYYGSRNGAVSGSAVTVAGTGALTGVGLYTQAGYRFKGKAGHKYLVHARVSAVDTGAASISVHLTDGSTAVNVTGNAVAVPSPAAGSTYTVAGVITAPEGWDGKDIQFYQRVNWADGALATGKRARFDPATILDLTEAYGAGKEPADVSRLTTMVQARPGGFISGTDLHFDLREVHEIPPVVQPVTPPDGGTPALTGPPVVLRFDDGFVNNLTNAAPILAKHGFRGTLYTVTRPADWSGAIFPMLTPAQLRTLRESFGWEIGSHVHAHEDANQGDPHTWGEKLRASCQDLVDMGLPWPRTFAYPNGSRNVVSDRYAYRLFANAGLTGHPTLTPARRDAPTFYHRWTTINGLSPEAGIAQAKAYVRESTVRGEVPVLGFHGVTDGVPPEAHHISKADLASIMDWLAAEGYSTITAGELMPHNMIMDPGFESRTFGYPWVAGAGWTRTRSTAAGHTGYYGADLASGGTGTLHQNVAAQPGTQHRVRARIGAGSSVTGGTVTVRVQPQTPVGTAVGSPLVVGTVPASVASEVDVTATVTMPSGAGVARLEVAPSSFVGSVRVVHAALYQADLYDPLA